MPNRATVNSTLGTSCIGMEQTRTQMHRKTHHIKANWGSEQANKTETTVTSNVLVAHMLQIHRKFECKWSVCSTQLNSTEPNQTWIEYYAIPKTIQNHRSAFVAIYNCASFTWHKHKHAMCTRSDNGSLPKMMLTTSMKIAAQHSETERRTISM